MIRHRKSRVLAVVVTLLACFLVVLVPTVKAQTAAPAVTIPAPLVQALQSTAAASPSLQQGLQAIQQAQQTGDVSQIIQATGDAIAKTTAAASAVPSPASGYLGLASLFSTLVTPLLVGLFGIFQHKSNQAAQATAQAAHATAQAALASSSS